MFQAVGRIASSIQKGVATRIARTLIGIGLLVAIAVTSLGASFGLPRRSLVSSERDRGFDQALKKLNGALERDWDDKEFFFADDLTVARRLSLALTGSIPSLEEIRELESVSESRQRKWHLDKLLRDQRYYSYFAERLARSMVGVEVQPLIVYRRDYLYFWLMEKLQSQTPYDEIVRELISAKGSWANNGAVNFLTVDSDIDTWKGPDKNRVASRVARAFVGVNLDCAQCHDDPFAPWKQSDFESFAAFFSSVNQSWDGITDLVAQDSAAVPFRPELLPQTGSPRERLSQWVTSRENRSFARTSVNRIWTILIGSPLVTPLDNIPLDENVPAVLDLLAEEFVTSGFDLERIIRLIASSHVMALESKSLGIESHAAEGYSDPISFPISRLRPEQIALSISQLGSFSVMSQRSSYPLLRKIDDRLQGEHFEVNQFIQTFGDEGDKELYAQSLSVRHILLMMNDDFVNDRTSARPGGPLWQLCKLALNDAAIVEAAYLMVLTRYPSDSELAHFEQSLSTKSRQDRVEAAEDLFWSLVNSAEFIMNH